MALLGYGARIKQALLDHASQIGDRYSNARFARELGIAERGAPYTGQAVGDWISEKNEPSLKTFRAMAKVLGKEVAWLMALDIQPAAAAQKRGAERIGVDQFIPAPRTHAKRKRDGGVSS